MNRARHLANIITRLALPIILMVSPLASNSKCLDLTSVPMLAELGMRLSLQTDDICAGAVLEAVWLGVD
jgi:hypothetical protein